jgi:hypothetical protein
LILPWVRVKNLASLLLSRAMRRLGAGWRRRYGREPLLVDTLVGLERDTRQCTEPQLHRNRRGLRPGPDGS